MALLVGAPLLSLGEIQPGNSPLPDLIAAARLDEMKWPEFPAYKLQVQSFYEKRNFAPAWTRSGALTAPAAAIISVFRHADAEGLDPEDYDASRWPDRLASLERRPRSEAGEARFDLALTVSLMRLIADLHFGRANPGLFHSSFDLAGENTLADYLARRLVDAPDAAAALEAVEPPYDGYHYTEQALRRYLEIARENSEWPALSAVKKPIEPGGAYPEATLLAERLRALGDLRPDAAVPPEVYSGPLVDAVKRFQARHGLPVDGRIGKATLAQLNIPPAARLRQLQLTMERWRWVPHSFARPPVVVNIPEFRLRALNPAYHTELAMKVVVGKALRNQTPVFTEDMKYVIFRPYWEVPFSIQRAELVPKIARDPAYLAKNHFEVVTAGSQVVTAPVDEALLARLRSGELHIRQTPGPENSLGLVKFLFPNSYNVYLHGTPATELFERSRRDFSHGCIRVEKPAELAEWVLRQNPGWTRQRILDAMNGDRTFQVTVAQPIPVLIVYATAVALGSGEVHYFDDIYGQDASLEKAIARRYPDAASPAPHAP